MYLPMWLIIIGIIMLVAYVHQNKKPAVQQWGYNPFPSNRPVMPTELTGGKGTLTKTLVVLGEVSFGLSVVALISTWFFGWWSILASAICATVGLVLFGCSSITYKAAPKEFFSIKREEERKARSKALKEDAQDALLWLYGIGFGIVLLIGLIAVLFKPFN